MQLSVTGKQLDVGSALRDHVEQRLGEAVTKYFDHVIEATVTFSREAHHLRSDISVHVGRGIMVQAQGEADNAYTAFDNASERVAKQLRRYKRRLRDHHRKQARPDDQAFAQQYVLAASDDVSEEDDEQPADDKPVVIAETTTEIERLTVGEAVMRMELADQAALVFRNSVHGGLNVVYRRRDGNFGWIDPEGNNAGGTGRE